MHTSLKNTRIDSCKHTIPHTRADTHAQSAPMQKLSNASAYPDNDRRHSARDSGRDACIYMYVYLYIYIYIHMCIYFIFCVYIYIYIYVHTRMLLNATQYVSAACMPPAMPMSPSLNSILSCTILALQILQELGEECVDFVMYYRGVLDISYCTGN